MVKLNKQQKKALKIIYKHYPHAFDPNNVVNYDCSTPSHKRSCQGHRLSWSKTPLLLNLYEISDLCFNDSPEILKTTYPKLEQMIEMGLIQKIPDLEKKKQKIGYDGKKLADNEDVDVYLYQITDKGIQYASYWKNIVISVLWWLVSTFVTASGIALLLKLMGVFDV